MIGETSEPYFVGGAGAIVIAVGLYLLVRALGRAGARARRHRHHGHDAAAHARAHAREIETRFADGKATNLQTIGFGLVGGMIPCPAAITVLLLCLGIGQFWLGIGMVASFSIGLAVTLVAVGIAAVLGLWGIRALPGHEAARRIWPHPPVAKDQGPSACEGMISSESRMREIRTSGLMSGDWKRGHGSRTEMP